MSENLNFVQFQHCHNVREGGGELGISRKLIKKLVGCDVYYVNFDV